MDGAQIYPVNERVMGHPQGSIRMSCQTEECFITRSSGKHPLDSVAGLTWVRERLGYQLDHL